MAGMSLIGAGAMMDGFDDMVDTFSSDSDGYRVANAVEYVAYNEFGTARMSGTPHFRPGMDATEAQMAQIAARADSLDDFLRQTALRWERETKSRAPVGETGNLKAGWTTEPL